MNLICNFDLKSDISKSMFFLVEKGYYIESYYVSYQSTKSTKSTKGIVFAYFKNLKNFSFINGWCLLIQFTKQISMIGIFLPYIFIILMDVEI